MRVLHVHSGNLYGGIETTLLAQAGHRDPTLDMHMSFALCFEGRLSQALHEFPSPVYSLGGTRIRNPLSVRSARRQLKNLLSRESFDVVLTHSCWSQAIFGPVVKTARLPLVFWLHDAARGVHWLERWAKYCAPDFVICNSRLTSQAVSNLYPGTPNAVIHPPHQTGPRIISPEQRRELRRSLNTPDDAAVIIQVSRMEEWKGHEALLRALALLHDLPSWVCWQVGGPQRTCEKKYFARIKELTVSLGIADRLRFLGPRSDVNRLLLASDIFCQPNLRPEPFGLVFVEALNAGLPIVTTTGGGGAEILGTDYGLLVPKGEAKALAATLLRLIENPTLRNESRVRGPSRAKEFCDVSTQMRKLNSSLEWVMNEFREKTCPRTRAA